MNWWIAAIGIALMLAVILGMRVRRVRSRLIKWDRALRQALHELSLLAAVSIAIGGGVVIVLLATWILRQMIHTSTKDADPIDITKLSFTVAAGVGAAVALVVAYRRQRDVEQGRFVERFGAAAAQLGDHDVAVRIAGVYAMAGVADESAGPRRQQCIDVLCGYLRLPYSPELGSNHQTKLVVTEPPGTGPDGAPIAEQERHLEFRQNDKEVRATIVRVIADHLGVHEYSWSAYDFDFRTAHLEDVTFIGAEFGSTAKFDKATFSGPTRFNDTNFSGMASFNETTFADVTSFRNTKFSAMATFGETTFSGPALFNQASFSDGAWFAKTTFADDTEFDEATFTGGTYFNRTTFAGDVTFDEAKFPGMASFNEATFSDGASFDAATFSGDAVWFDDATFSGNTRFSKAKFSSGVHFVDTTFSANTWFNNIEVSGTATFNKSTFSGPATFDEAVFAGPARFNMATFSEFASFNNTTFANGFGASHATFSEIANFNNATFSGDLALFDGATFAGPTRFHEAAFSSMASFKNATLSGGISFSKANFGIQPISFDSPRRWGPPPPEFDWNGDLALKPHNVMPEEWPPRLIS